MYPPSLSFLIKGVLDAIYTMGYRIGHQRGDLMADEEKSVHSKETERPEKEATTKPPRRRLVAEAAKETVQFVGPGDVLEDRYEILEELGRGGMGIVFKALDRSLEMNVAIKVLPPELCGSKRAIKDLKREAKMAMQLNHPGIMALRHFADSGAVKFLVMELLEGQTLEDKLVEEEILDVPEVCELASQIGEALDFAHSAKVVHRDIKPANIFLKEKGDSFAVSLMDFGIARQIKDSMSRVSKVDTSGTLCYISPEQMRGKRADGRADIYSLAASLYECMAGHPPFYRGTISFQILNEKPAPIEDIPEQVNAALLKALAKDPEDRFKTATEFAKALAGEVKTATNKVSATGTTKKPEKEPITEAREDSNKKEERPSTSAPVGLPRAVHSPFFKHAIAPLLVCLVLSSIVFATYSNSLIARLFGQPVLDNRPRQRPVRTALKKGAIKTAKNLADYWRTVGEPSEKMCRALIAGVQIAMKGVSRAQGNDATLLAAAIYPPEDEKVQQELIEATGRAKANAIQRKRQAALNQERETKARAEAARLKAEERARAAERARTQRAKAEAEEKAQARARAKARAEADERAKAARAKAFAAAERERRRKEAAKQAQDSKWKEKKSQRRNAVFNPQITVMLFPKAHKSSAILFVKSLNANPLYRKKADERRSRYYDVFASSEKAFILAENLKKTLDKEEDPYLVAYRNYLNEFPDVFNIELDLALFVAERCSPVVGFALFCTLPAHPGRKSNLEKIARWAQAAGDTVTAEAARIEQGRTVTPLKPSQVSSSSSYTQPAATYYSGPVRCTFRLTVHKYSHDFVKRVTMQLTPLSSGASTSGTWQMKVEQKGKTKTVRPYIQVLNVMPGKYRVSVYVDGWTRMPLPVVIPTLRPGTANITVQKGLRTSNVPIGTYNMKKGR